MNKQEMGLWQERGAQGMLRFMVVEAVPCAPAVAKTCQFLFSLSLVCDTMSPSPAFRTHNTGCCQPTSLLWLSWVMMCSGHSCRWVV